MIRQKAIFILLLNFCLVISPAQEVIVGLQSNPDIIKNIDIQKKKSSLLTSGMIEIPFFDDFSGNHIFPDNSKWLDFNVYINNTYSDKQITKGIATLDALDNTGRLYETAVSSGFKADMLTSQPINLNYSVSENIWLSFFYQGGGFGDVPEAKDSLTLEFLAPEESKWYSVWRAEGKADLKFNQVILNISNARFLKNGFQFRFVNYGSITSDLSDPSMIGNCDIWNIDYVMLDKNRNAADTVYPDVAFRLPLRSILKTYEAMPWKQFLRVQLQEMGSSITIDYRNNDLITRNATRDFEIWDEYENSLSEFFSAGATNIPALTSVTYNANLIYTFNSSYKDSALFRITSSLKTDAFDQKDNDTLIYYQRFNNYFAFDDGTAEAGYGINGQGSRNAMMAYRFTSFIDDTLRAINISFNDSYMNSNLRSFDLMVWDDNKGLPGNVIYQAEDVIVEKTATINGFYTYVLPEYVTVNSTFYVGWKQNSETFLNAGFDVNTPNKGRQLYWLNGEWKASQREGSVMIRPVMGERLGLTSVEDFYNTGLNRISIWPNPAHDYIRIDPGDSAYTGLLYVTITDLSGRIVIKEPYSERIDISSLHEGMYIIITSLNGKALGYNRLMKTR